MSSVYNYIDVLTPSGLFSWRGAVRDGVQLMLQVNMILTGIPRIQTWNRDKTMGFLYCTVVVKTTVV